MWLCLGWDLGNSGGVWDGICWKFQGDLGWDLGNSRGDLGWDLGCPVLPTYTLAWPPRQFCSRKVSLLFLYGMCGSCRNTKIPKILGGHSPGSAPDPKSGAPQSCFSHPQFPFFPFSILFFPFSFPVFPIFLIFLSQFQFSHLNSPFFHSLPHFPTSPPCFSHPNSRFSPQIPFPYSQTPQTPSVTPQIP